MHLITCICMQIYVCVFACACVQIFIRVWKLRLSQKSVQQLVGDRCTGTTRLWYPHIALANSGQTYTHTHARPQTDTHYNTRHTPLITTHPVCHPHQTQTHAQHTHTHYKTHTVDHYSPSLSSPSELVRY